MIPLEQYKVPMPLYKPSLISPSYLSISLFLGYVIVHSPQRVPKQKSPSQIMPSLYVYLPFPCIWPSFILPQYLSPFLNVTSLFPYGPLLLKSPSRVNYLELYSPKLAVLPLLNYPEQISPFGRMYLPLPCKFPFSKFPSRTLSYARYFPDSFYSRKIVILPFPSKDERFSISPLKVTMISLFAFFFLSCPFLSFPDQNNPSQRMLALSINVPFPLIQDLVHYPSYTYYPLLILPVFGTPSINSPQNVAPFLKVNFPLPSGILFLALPLYYSLFAYFMVI